RRRAHSRQSRSHAQVRQALQSADGANVSGEPVSVAVRTRKHAASPDDGFHRSAGRNFGDELGGAPSRFVKIKGGNDLLPKAFAAKLADKILYDSPAVKIDQDEKSARVTFSRKGKPETLSADRILCAVPFSLLRNVVMPANFAEKKLAAIRDLKYDAVSRVYLQTKKRSWEEKGLNGFAFTKDAVEVWQPTWSQPGPRGIIMTYARPGEAEKIAALKESDRINSTLVQLDPMFPGLRGNFEKGTSKIWMEDDWSRGAWAFAGLGNLVLFAQPEGRIHFAGEHLSFFPLGYKERWIPARAP